MVFVVLGLGASKGSTSSGSGLKRLRRWGHSLKSHPTLWFGSIGMNHVLQRDYRKMNINFGLLLW